MRRRRSRKGSTRTSMTKREGRGVTTRKKRRGGGRERGGEGVVRRTRRAGGRMKRGDKTTIFFLSFSLFLLFF